METKQKGNVFYGWYIVGAGFVLLGFSVCIVMNCAGLFVKPVTEALGFSRKAFALNTTLISLAMMGVSLSTGAIFERFDVKKVMCVASVGLPVFYFLYSRASTLPVFYILSVFVGIFLGLVGFVPVSILITAWFQEKRGLATGIAFTGSGVFGLLLCPLIAKLITSLGWRAAYAALGVSMLAVMAPVTFFVLRSRPEKMGLAPYGQHPAKTETPCANSFRGFLFKDAVKTVSFWTFAVVAGLSCMIASSYIQQISAYVSDIGYTTAFAATANSLVLGALAIGKIALGQMYDKKGTMFSSFFGIVCFLISLAFLLFAQQLPMLLASVAFSGMGLAFCSVPYPIVTKRLFGGADYNKIYGVINAAASVGTALGSPIAASFFDATGSYRSFWLFGFILLAICGVLYLVTEKKAPLPEKAGPLPENA